VPDDLPPELRAWAGVQSPRYTPVPDEILDLWMAHLTESEFKVLVYICRRTFGFKKDADHISLEQIATGIVRRDGRRLDYGTGLARKSVQRGLAGLLEKGLIVQQRTYDAAGRDQAPLYALRWRDGQIDALPAPGADNLSRVGASESPPQETEQHTDFQEDVTPHYSAYIAAVVLDHARELGAEPRGPAGVETALRHWQASGQDEAAFVARLHVARDAVRQRQKPGADKWSLYLAALRAISP
jgi:hypothetical protein